MEPEKELEPKLSDAIATAVEKSNQMAVVAVDSVSAVTKKTVLFIGLGFAAAGGIAIYIIKKFRKK